MAEAATTEQKAKDEEPSKLSPATTCKPSKKNLDVLAPYNSYKKDIESILLTEEAIKARIKEMGEQISKDYYDVIEKKKEKLVIVGLLRGAFMFTADLVRCVTVSHEVDFMMLQQRKGEISIKLDLSKSVEDHHILIVEDLIDSGSTLMWLAKHLEEIKKVKSVKIACFLSKNTKKRKKEFVTNVTVDYLGFVSPDDWAVGYGMDHDQIYRSLPVVGCLKSSVYGGGLLFDPNKKKWTD
eukprot:77843_1